MSLLNDALRKKNREIKKAENAELIQGPLPARKSKRTKPALIGGLLLLCGGLSLGSWYLWESLPGRVDARIAPGLSLRDTAGEISTPGSDPKENFGEKTEPTGTALQSITNFSPTLESPQPARVQRDPDTLSGSPNQTSRPETSRTAENPTKTHTDDAQNTVAEQTTSSQAREKSLFFQKALRYHQQGKLQQAIGMYQQVLGVDRDHKAALLNLSAAFIQVAAFSEAYPLLKHLREIDRDNPDVLVNLAIVEIGLGRAAEAIDFLQLAASRYDTPQFGIFFHHAAALSQLGKLEEARAFYKKAEELNPNHSSLIFNLAVLTDKLQSYDEAVQYYRRFLQQNDLLSIEEKNQIEARIRSLRAYPPAKLNPIKLRAEG
jgi:Flp pilus assembly protein TadD